MEQSNSLGSLERRKRVVVFLVLISDAASTFFLRSFIAAAVASTGFAARAIHAGGSCVVAFLVFLLLLPQRDRGCALRGGADAPDG